MAVEEQNNLQADKKSIEQLIDNGKEVNDGRGDADPDWIYLSRFCFDVIDDQYDKGKDQERLDRYVQQVPDTQADKESIEELIDNGEEGNDGWGYTGPDWTDPSLFHSHFDSDKERWDRYLQQVRDTAGFDVDTPPENRERLIKPFALYDHPPNTPGEYRTRRHSIPIRQCAIRALELYSRRTAKNLHLVDVIKANLVSESYGFNYWITFTAVDEDKTRMPKTYQTQAYYRGYKEFPDIDVRVFRPKPTHYC